MNNDLLLLSKEDIPFIEAQLVIHQPTIKEISLIGEETFHTGCQILILNKQSLKIEDKTVLDDKSDFEILMAIMCSREYCQYKNKVISVLALLLPDYKINFTESSILLASENSTTRIDKTNFEIFKDILVSMFDLKEDGSSSDYNPISKKGEKIAEKLRKAKERKNKNKNKVEKISIYSRYASILAIGLKEDLNVFMEYTPYQLMDQLTRYQMKEASDLHVKAQMAGATGLDEVDNWMDDIHS